MLQRALKFWLFKTSYLGKVIEAPSGRVGLILGISQFYHFGSFCVSVLPCCFSGKYSFPFKLENLTLGKNRDSSVSIFSDI